MTSTEQDTLFSKTEGSPTPTKAPESGLLVTNHLNLMYMLAAGLVMPPAGFGGKYYQDTLGFCPGWIPLFIGKPFREAIELSTSEAKHLKPICVEIGLSCMSGHVWALAEDGMKELRFPDQLAGSEQVVLVPAPLPTSWIESIAFQSVENRRICEADAKDYGNVPLSHFKRKTVKTLFSKASAAPWPPEQGPAARTVPLQTPLAAGGIMAMLLHFANQGNLGVIACRHAFDSEDDQAPPVETPVLSPLRAWMQTGAVPMPRSLDAKTDRASLQNASQEQLFWGLIERLVNWKGAGEKGSAEDVLLNYLKETLPKLDARLQAGISGLRDTLVSLTGLADASNSELFERHVTPFARAATLFFLRRDCPDLLDFHNDQLHELDWLAAAILFGVRDGWLKLPLRLRDTPGLSASVSHRMARMAHRIAGTDIELGESPARIRPLRELLGDGSNWHPRSREKGAALELARTQQWDCVHTRISLGRGSYALVVEGGSAHIEVPGEPRIVPEIDLPRFLDCLAKAHLDPKTEAKVRKMLQD